MQERLVLSEKDRKQLFKIECQSEILFSDWKPDGKIYKKQLTLKNVSNQLITLTYKLPEIPCFFTPFPDQIVLPIGMTYSIDVSFQPVDRNEQHAYLSFHVNQYNDDFHILLRGELPLLSAKIEPHTYFPIPTAVNEETEHSVILENDGEIPMLFEFSLLDSSPQQPFHISPRFGHVLTGESLKITYRFSPKQSGQITSKVNMRIKKTDTDAMAKKDYIDYPLLLTASAKFPYFVIKCEDVAVDELEFTDVSILQEPFKNVFIENQSDVQTNFKIVRELASDKPLDQILIQPTEGVIPPRGSFPIKVTFRPYFSQSFNQIDCGDPLGTHEEFDERLTFHNNNPHELRMRQTFKIKSSSLIVKDMNIVCQVQPAQMEITSSKIDFGTIKCGDKVQKSFYVKNNTRFDCPYQFVIEGFSGSENLMSAECYAEQGLIQFGDNQNDITNVPVARTVNLYPLYVYPSSGVASSQINTTINVVLDLSKYTTKRLTLQDKYDGKSYIPPQPISTYIQYKTPGSPTQFIHVTATIIPDTGDYRSAPITMDYAEKFHEFRKMHTIDRLFQNLIACNGKHANAKLSPLFNESLVEFETETTKTIKISDQSLNKNIIDYDPHDEEYRMRSNALLPSDAIMVEFNGIRANFNDYGSDISDRFYNFGYVQAGTQQQKIIVVTNKSSCLAMAVSVAGQQNRKGLKLDFLGISDVYEVTTLRSLVPTNITPSDGIDVHTCASRGLTVLVPPTKYAYFQVTCTPDIPDEYYYGSYTFFCTHQPLLLYRCFRHAVVGYGDVREVRVLASSRDVNFPALASTVPTPSRPIVDGFLKLPPTAPGSVTRQTFALVNNSTSTFTISLTPLKQSYINVYPQCALMQPHSTLVISVSVTFPTDSLTAKERYGLEGVPGKSQSAMFENELIFNVNNSKQTVIKIGLVAICSALDVVYDCAGVEIPVFGEPERPGKLSGSKKITSDFEAAMAQSIGFGDGDLEDEALVTSTAPAYNKHGPAIVQMQMSPVSLCSEGIKLFTLVNKSFLPVNILSRATDALQEKYASITEPDTLMAGCEDHQFQLLLQAKDQWLHEGPLTLNISMSGELPRQFCAPTPENFNVFAENTNKLICNYNQLLVQTQVSKRTIQVEPHTINLKNVVPYDHVDITLKVKNNSHCQIAYTLEIHEIKEYMPKLDFEAIQLPMRKYAYEIGADQGDFMVPVLYNRVSDPESVMPPDVQARCPQVFVKQGAGNVVLPHNEATILLSVKPHDSTPVRLRVFAKIVEIDTVDRSLGDVIKELEQQACYIQGDTKSFQQYYSNHLDREKMVESKIEVQTCYPKFFITDISCPKIGSSQLRDILNVDRINDFLSQPVTMNERIYNTPGSKRDQLIKEAEAQGKLRLRQYIDEDAFRGGGSEGGSLEGSRGGSRGSSLDGSAGEMLDHEIESKLAVESEDDDKDELLLTEFPLILGPDNQSETRRYFVTLTLSNPEEVECHISLDLPKGLDLNDVPWATELPNLRKQRTMSLLARHIYSVAPQEITLLPGQKRSVSISYSHIEEGVHELSVLCKIRGGRTFFLHLIGSTLSKFEPAIIVPIEQKLLPVPLGEKIPPRQFLKIYNPGQVYIQYSLANPRLIFDILDPDDEPDEPLEENPWTDVRTVLDCLNPEGMLAPDSALEIVLQFKPTQVGLVHIQYDICINKVSQSTYEAYVANHVEKKYFDNEISGELLNQGRHDHNDVMAGDLMHEIEIKVDSSGMSALDKLKAGLGSAKKQSNAEAAPELQLGHRSVLTQNPLVNNVYQTLDLFAYGFVKSTSIPTQIMPSFCKNGSPSSPACGAVSLQNIALAKRSGLITQRGLGYAELSCGRLVFGAVPVFSSISSVITIKALTQKRPGYVRFSIENLPSNTNFKIRASPQAGTLQFEEEIEIALVIETGALPSAFLHDIAFMVEFVPEGKQQVNAFNNSQIQGGNSRLPTVLANTVASAARVAETAILQRFNPVEINRAGLDQQPRQAHAMLYGVEDYVSNEKVGPLSQYQEIPSIDVVWLTVNIHSHRQSQLHLYDNQFYGIMPNTRCCSFEKQKIAYDRPKQPQQLNMVDQLQLENIVKLTLRDSINQLIADKATMIAANRARRDVINGLQRVNFFDTHDNDLVQMIDDQVQHNKKNAMGITSQQDTDEISNFLDQINHAFYDKKTDL